MKIRFSPIHYYGKTLFVAVGFGIIGYFIFPYLPENLLADKWVLSMGVFLGIVLAPFITHIYMDRSEPTTEIVSIYVGNLAFKANSRELRELFTPYGSVNSVRLMSDRETRQPRGFGFVEMERKEAKTAIKAVNGTEFLGRTIKVSIANERQSN